MLRKCLVFVGISILILGCDGPEFVHVSGKITFQGKPLSDVEVQFIPIANQEYDYVTTSLYTDSQGEYSTLRSGSSGVLVGNHHVCLNDARIMMPRSNLDAESGALNQVSKIGLPNSQSDIRRTEKFQVRIPHRYSDVIHTPLRDISVTQGNQVLNFDIKKP